MRGKKARALKRDNLIKGDIVERIVEQMHRVRGVVVQRNVRLSSTQNPNRKREIDLLLTGQVVGYPVRFAFECKNYDKPANVVRIGEFADKLDDVGIAPQNSIFVSASGFTDGALDRAKQLGMQTLVLSGLADDRLASRVIGALQSVVFLLPVVTQWTVLNDAAEVTPEEMWIWFNDRGEPQATTPDLMWHRWCDGYPPSVIGVHEVKVEVPGWAQRVAGKPSVPTELRFTVHVHGLVITVTGRASDHALIDAFTQEMKKRRVNVNFDQPDTNLPLRIFESEEEYNRFIDSRPEQVKIVNRVRLPRLQWQGLFWPISDRVRRELETFGSNLKPGQVPTAEDFARLERHGLASVWEPPAAIPRKPASP